MLMLLGCAPSNKSFFSRKYPTETRKSYSEKRGLMILKSEYLGRNKAIYSRHNRQTKRKAYREYKRNSRFRRFKR